MVIPILLCFGLLVVAFYVLTTVPSLGKTKQPDIVIPDPSKPYETAPIRDLDDYEYSLIFQNEGSREASDAVKNYAMSRYPLDWSLRPPSDGKFQAQREAFLDASHRKEMSSVVAQEEEKILQTYVPKKSADLLTYSLTDVKTLVDKVYDLKGLVPTIVPSEQGPNVYEITEVHKKNEPIVWESGKEDESTKSEMRGEMQIEIPRAATDVSASMDPFYEPRTALRTDKHDYTQWTSGLERQFAPTYPAKYWY